MHILVCVLSFFYSSKPFNTRLSTIFMIAFATGIRQQKREKYLHRYDAGCQMNFFWLFGTMQIERNIWYIFLKYLSIKIDHIRNLLPFFWIKINSTGCHKINDVFHSKKIGLWAYWNYNSKTINKNCYLIVTFFAFIVKHILWNQICI